MIRSDAKVSWRWLLGVWSIPILCSAFATYAYSRESDRPLSLARALWLGADGWLVWIVLTPVIVWLGQHWPVDRRKHWRFAARHLAAAALVGGIASAVSAILIYSAASGKTFASFVSSGVLLYAPMESLVYFIILGLSYLIINTRRLAEREVFAERLSRELTEAQLGALRMQLQPHFLFNSLNAVMALVRDQATDRADRALILLSDVLRTTLRQGTLPRVPLTEEVAFIRHYLEIEMLRFGDRLRVIYSIPDDLRNAPVPTFILQPLVENALQHGLLNLPEGGTLQISAEKSGQRLILTVTDDGAGLSAEWEDRAQRAVGITNVRSRLAHMYGSDASLVIAPRTDRTGTRAIVELPFESGV